MCPHTDTVQYALYIVSMVSYVDYISSMTPVHTEATCLVLKIPLLGSKVLFTQQQFNWGPLHNFSMVVKMSQSLTIFCKRTWTVKKIDVLSYEVHFVKPCHSLARDPC